MDAQLLYHLMGKKLPMRRYEHMLPAFMEASHIAGITTPRRMAMWCAQLGHESGGLAWFEEFATGDVYEGRRDLGNTQPGDGRRFKGRGPIQLTGRANYRAFTQWANNNGFTNLDFEANPDLVKQDRWGFLAAAHYWTVRRPQLNELSDRGDVMATTRAINGGLNGLGDRTARYQTALTLLSEAVEKVEKVLDYPRERVAQETGYFCGPASTQTILRAATGRWYEEAHLAKRLGTHVGGTDYIGQFLSVLNAELPGAAYQIRNLGNYPRGDAKEQVWRDLTNSINAGYGLVVNIVAPPSNYPRAVAPSTISPAYGGGTVYHYVAAMGYAEDQAGRRVWIADSGFRPYGYWVSFDQLCTLIPPKGYAYATKPAPINDEQEGNVMQELMRVMRDAWTQLRGPGGNGWPQLGKNSKGENLTLVDAVAATRVDLSRVEGKLDQLLDKPKKEEK